MQAEEKVFQASKQLLISAPVLVHFNPELDITLACDASAYGIGAVLSHRLPDGMEQPIGFASRTLSDAEKKYSQIEKEGLACVFGVKKFHSYLYGHPFTLITDHKPLQTLFSESRAIPLQASSRIQRWALTLATYEYHLKFRCTTQHMNADALSRLSLPEKPKETPLPAELVLLVEHLQDSPVSVAQIREWTKRNPLLAQVLRFVNEGWPEQYEEGLKPYAPRSTELSVHDGCLLWGGRVIVPPPGREAVLRELHGGHPGISRMKALARMYVWWPGLDRDIEEMVQSCHECQQCRPSPPPAPLHPWKWPSCPWSRLHLDYAGPFQGHMFLVLIDAHSKWIEVFKTSAATSKVTIECLRCVFAQFGLTEMVVTDNGPCFSSREFAKFLQTNGVHHAKSAPYHPASNGLTERAVQIFENGMQKFTEGNWTDRLSRFLFHYRSTPHSTTGVTPAELLLGRKLRSRLDVLRPDLGSKVMRRQMEQK